MPVLTVKTTKPKLRVKTTKPKPAKKRLRRRLPFIRRAEQIAVFTNRNIHLVEDNMNKFLADFYKEHEHDCCYAHALPIILFEKQLYWTDYLQHPNKATKIKPLRKEKKKKRFDITIKALSLKWIHVNLLSTHKAKESSLFILVFLANNLIYHPIKS